jgi:hypothetical protein
VVENTSPVAIRGHPPPVHRTQPKLLLRATPPTSTRYLSRAMFILVEPQPLVELCEQMYIRSLRTTSLLLYILSNLMPPHMYLGTIYRPIMAIAIIPKRAHAFRLYCQRCSYGYLYTSRVRWKEEHRSTPLRLAERPVLVIPWCDFQRHIPCFPRRDHSGLPEAPWRSRLYDLSLLLPLTARPTYKESPSVIMTR